MRAVIVGRPKCVRVEFGRKSAAKNFYGLLLDGDC